MQPFEGLNEFMLPPVITGRMQELVRRQSQGKLTECERRELEILTEAKHTVDLIRTKANALLASDQPASTKLRRSVRNGIPVVEVPAGTPPIDPEAVRRFLREQVF